MAPIDLSAVPDAHRDTAAFALGAAFDASDVSAVHTVAGGASGALTYRVQTRAGDHLLRIETLGGPLRNPHQYECMGIAAEAGIAPPVRYFDPDAGVVLMAFVEQRPLTDFPGGPPALVAAVADLLARLHRTPTFPSRGDHLDNLGRLLAHLDASGRVAPGLLERHVEGLERIRAAYPWQPDTFVSAHNDPNQFNLLYDGDRLWLVDWETAARNDPCLDVATAHSYLATTPELADILLRTWLGREPDALIRARVTLMGWLMQLFAGAILLTIVVDPATSTHTDLTPMSMADFGAGIERGELQPGTPTTTHAFAKIVLASFVEAMSTPAFDEALRIAAAG